tara:strand:- start:497 stop:1033 length:537 start_codon:yes stop_codon:yes gene_type:complete
MVLLIALALGSHSVSAKDPKDPKDTFSEYDIKAAYLINFVRYIEWPDTSFEREDSPFILGVLGKNPFGEALAHLAAEQKDGNRAIEVRISDNVDELKTSHLVFICAASEGDVASGLRVFEGKSVLTVGEQKGFLEKAGVINFLIVDTRVKFEINLKAARKQELKISAQLLKVAAKVIK